MKRIVMTTALTLSLTAPAFAQSQLERSLNVEPGKYTTAQLVELTFAESETGSDARVYFGGSRGHSARAAKVFAQIDAEDTGTRGLPILAGDSATMSSKSGHNAVAQRIFAETLASEDASDR